MIVVLSPAKTLNMAPATGFPLTSPQFPKEAAELAGICSTKSAGDLKKMKSGISDNVAALNAARYRAFDAQQGKQAALAFDGPAYRGLNANTFSKKQIAFAQVHLRILCGLYGILRPFDEIKPFRLEMGSKIETSRGSNLYQYWGDGITKSIDVDLGLGCRGGRRLLVNCASQEYWKSVKQDLLEGETEVITCEFPGPSVFAKRARGLMVRYIVENEVQDALGLQGFTGYGEDVYSYNKSKSNAASLCFVRRAGGAAKQAAKKSPGKHGVIKEEEEEEKEEEKQSADKARGQKAVVKEEVVVKDEKPSAAKTPRGRKAAGAAGKGRVGEVVVVEGGGNPGARRRGGGKADDVDGEPAEGGEGGEDVGGKRKKAGDGGRGASKAAKEER